MLGCPRIQLYVDSERPALDEERATFRALIKRRVEGEPVAHLVGYREFYKLKFRVSPDVLIPRPETELLVVETLTLLKCRPSPKVLDVGTGSGCVALSIAHEHPTAEVTAVDVSEAALAVARQNAEDHDLTARVRFAEGDLFAPLSADEQFDVIVSNPPYIAADEFAELSPEVAEREPRLALDGGPDGFDVIRRLVADSRGHLRPDGRLMIEIGYRQSPVVGPLFADYGFTDVQVLKDNSRQPRVVTGVVPNPA